MCAPRYSKLKLGASLLISVITPYRTIHVHVRTHVSELRTTYVLLIYDVEATGNLQLMEN